jgi:hypothetical protein
MPHAVEGYTNIGTVLYRQERWAEAISWYNKAIALRPDFAYARFARACVWLRQGNFEQGWPEYGWRWRCADAPRCRFTQPQWDGSPLAGRTILLHAEGGLGDALHFIRYVPLVKKRGGTVIVECFGRVAPLLTDCSSIDHMVVTGTALPAIDVQASFMSLPAILGTRLATIPAEVPYIRADAERVAYWRQQLERWPGRKVGIVWQGDRRHRHDRRRSVPLALFRPLAQIPGVQLVSLQHGDGTEQLAALDLPFPVVDLGSRFETESLSDAAAVMMSLDLVIAIDSGLAHLAGALGRPVWTLVYTLPDFRWLLNREDSPWYPTMRLFRQTEAGQWEPVFERVAEALRAMVALSTNASSCLGHERKVLGGHQAGTA